MSAAPGERVEPETQHRPPVAAPELLLTPPAHEKSPANPRRAKVPYSDPLSAAERLSSTYFPHISIPLSRNFRGGRKSPAVGGCGDAEEAEQPAVEGREFGYQGGRRLAGLVEFVTLDGFKQVHSAAGRRTAARGG